MHRIFLKLLLILSLIARESDADFISDGIAYLFGEDEQPNLLVPRKRSREAILEISVSEKRFVIENSEHLAIFHQDDSKVRQP